MQLNSDEASGDDSGMGKYEAVAPPLIAGFHREQMERRAQRVPGQQQVELQHMDPPMQVQVDTLKILRSMRRGSQPAGNGSASDDGDGYVKHSQARVVNELHRL